jgi:hypothetical protein
MSGDVRFNAMFFLPYIHLPENQKDFKSLWVDFSNKYYDPVKGHELYQRYLSELVLADRLGFDAIVINEHHNTVYSMMADSERDCRRDHPSNQERQDLRLGCSAELHASESVGGGVRHPRRSIERPAGDRLPAGDGNGILGSRREPGYGPREI